MYDEVMNIRNICKTHQRSIDLNKFIDAQYSLISTISVYVMSKCDLTVVLRFLRAVSFCYTKPSIKINFN